MVPNTIDATTGEEIPTILSRDHLRTLDTELAAYPLYRWNGWKALVSCVQDEDVVRLLGRRRKLDSLWESPADDEVVPGASSNRAGKEELQSSAGQQSTAQDGQLLYAPFDLKRSWRKGVVGEEVTVFSRDKSWLLQHVINRQFGGGKSTVRIACEFHVDMYSAQIVCACWPSCSSLSSFSSTRRTFPLCWLSRDSSSCSHAPKGFSDNLACEKRGDSLFKRSRNSISDYCIRWPLSCKVYRKHSSRWIWLGRDCKISGARKCRLCS